MYHLIIPNQLILIYNVTSKLAQTHQVFDPFKPTSNIKNNLQALRIFYFKHLAFNILALIVNNIYLYSFLTLRRHLLNIYL